MRFYLNRSGQAEGPFEEAALLAMIQRGEVPPAAHVCPEGGQAWQPVTSHPSFARGPAAPAPPKPVAATLAMDSAMVQAAVLQSQSQAGFAQAPPRPAAPASAYGHPHSGQPSFQAPMQAAPKNNLPLIIGGGCGVLLLIALCGGCAIFAVGARAQHIAPASAGHTSSATR